VPWTVTEQGGVAGAPVAARRGVVMPVTTTEAEVRGSCRQNRTARKRRDVDDSVAQPGDVTAGVVDEVPSESVPTSSCWRIAREVADAVGHGARGDVGIGGAVVNVLLR
jgi:hypothetical protein